MDFNTYERIETELEQGLQDVGIPDPPRRSM